MRRFALPLLSAFTLLLSAPFVSADMEADLKDLVGKVNAKIRAGHRSEEDLQDEKKSFEAMQAEHAGEKSEPMAHLAFLLAALYADVFPGQREKGLAMLKQVGVDYPHTKYAEQAITHVATMERRAKAAEEKKAMVGKPMPDFEQVDLEGKPLSIASRKGKVVFVDFWATWCNPCVQEMPHLVKAYEKYRDKGFEIIGISADTDKERLLTFLKTNNIPWPQYFDGKGPQNALSTQYGVFAYPSSFLIDTEGKLLESDLRGDQLEQALEKVFGKAE